MLFPSVRGYMFKKNTEVIIMLKNTNGGYMPKNTEALVVSYYFPPIFRLFHQYSDRFYGSYMIYRPILIQFFEIQN